MSRLGDTIAEAVAEIVESKLDEAVDTKLENLKEKLDELETSIDEMPDRRSIKKLVDFLDKHNMEELCEEVDTYKSKTQDLTERLERLEEAGTFNEGHKQIIIDVVRDQYRPMQNELIRDLIRKALNDLGIVDQTDNAGRPPVVVDHVLDLLREIRDLLKNKE